jgi:microcystin-dependent protein
MALPFYNWSRTAASNATADSTVNWAEGQSPSSVNDSARAMMASTAAFRDDISGATYTSGTSTAYALSTYQVFSANINGAMLAFTPHISNGNNPTLSVDGNTARPIYTDTVNPVPAGTLVAGTPYVVTFDNAHSIWILNHFFVKPYETPIGAVIDYFGSSVPNNNWALPYGQAISRSTYASLFSLMGTTYGSGDGSTTFNIPDLRGRVVAGKDDMGGSAASRLSGTSITVGGATTLGGSGGAETKALVTANLPPYTPSGTVSGSVTAISFNTRSVSASGVDTTNALSLGNSGGSSTGTQGGALISGTISGTLSGAAQGGTSSAFAVTQPTIIANKLLRII